MKLSSYIDAELSEENVLKKVVEMAKKNTSLMKYEKEKIESNIS